MMQTLKNIMSTQPWEGATMYNLLAALAILLISLIVRRVVAHLLASRLKQLTDRLDTELDQKFFEAVEAPLSNLILFIGVKIAGFAISLPTRDPFDLRTIFYRLVDSILIVLFAWLAIRGINVLQQFLGKLAELTESKLYDQLVPLMAKSLKLLAGAIAAIMVIQRLGYDVKALMGAFAIGGLAISLAAQDTLKNFFGSVFIFLDRPFQIGDWITAGDVDGTVEEVGFRSTKVRTFANSLVIVPNSRMADSAVENHSRMFKRRIKAMIGVTYSTSADQMERLVQGIERILIEHPGIRKDFYLVKFHEFADSSLGVFLYCFTVTTNWAEHLQVRQEVFLSIMRLVESLGLSFAFPSRSLYIEKWPRADTPPWARDAEVFPPTAGGAPGAGAQRSLDSGAPDLPPPAAP